MRKWIRKVISIVLAAAMLCMGLQGLGSKMVVQAEESAAGNNQQVFDILSGDEMIKDMGAGWNLGNTMDGHTGFTPNETVWQDVKTTKKLITKVHDLGFNTVRIPVTWGTMIDDENDYEINETWISRVQDIVDYCVSLDMYAIINIHHDGAEQTGWLRIATNAKETLKKKYAGVWKNIALRFKDYDEHLIFESMNEVRGENMTTVQENNMIMILNQLFVDTVRATGSNNTERWLMMPGKYNFIDSVCNTANNFSLPTDTIENRLIVSVHIYTPWSFCGAEVTSSSTYSVSELKANDAEVKPLYDTYTSKGIPVVVGEYGCINKGNPSERAFYLEGVNRIFKKYKCVGVYWDQGWYDRSLKPDYSFTIVDRSTGEPIEKEVTDGLLRGCLGLDGATDYSTLTKSPDVIKATKLTPSVSKVEMNYGEKKQISVSYAPDNSNDVVVWKSSDSSVATVYNGKIHAKGIGQATITAYTQSGSTSVEIPITVNKLSTGSVADVSVEKTSYAMNVDDYAYLNTQLSNAAQEDALYYYSENENIASVSSVGKIVAVGVGTVSIWACSSSGSKKEIKVTVTKKEVAKEIKLSINVYYSNNAKAYYGNEIGKSVITINKNGQYELTFDCDSDLSVDAVKKGITSLKDITAIYIKDYQVATGALSKSILKTCNIRYDEIYVDDTKLTITNSTPKSALKASGIFDTNDPINGWDGSVVKEVSYAGNVANFSTVTEPKKIRIKFTLSDMLFEGEEISLETDNPVSTIKQNTTTSTTIVEKKGKTYTVSSGKYMITKVAGKKIGTVTYMAPKSKTVTSVTIPSTVKYAGKKYKVTKIANLAFAKCKKLKNVTIPSGITKIGTKAFYKCKKLTRITIKAKKLTSKTIGKNAFKGIASKAVIRVPKSKVKTYKKILKKKGIGKKVKVKK